MTDACSDHEPRLSAYLDGELADGEAVEVTQHLRTCPVCDGALERLAAVRSLMRSLPVRRLPPAAVRGLADATRASRGVRGVGETAPARPSTRTARFAAAGAIGIGLLAGTAFALGGQPAAGTRTVAVPLDVFVADHMAHTVDGPVALPVLADAKP